MATHSYLLSEARKGSMEKRGYEFRCQRCGEPIESGDKMVSKQKAKRGSRWKVYHEGCWLEMLM